MGCLSASAELVREKKDVDSSLLKEDVYAEAILDREPLKADASLQRDKINIEASMICTIGKDNSLWASDGVLYDGNSQPIFSTEAWEN